MPCPRCRVAVLSELNVRVAAATCTLRACPQCEGRWWLANGVPVGLGDVLAAYGS